MSEFKSLASNLLIERDGTFSKCSTQVNLSKGKDAILRLANKVSDEDLHDYGRENEPHCSVLYGIKPSMTALYETRAAIQSLGIESIRGVIGDCSLFENDEFDVVKFEVISEDLHRLNSAIRNSVDYENDYPDYNPHITVAYVKPGCGRRYADTIGSAISGYPLEFSQIMFSNTNGDKIPIELGYPGNEDAKHPNTQAELDEDLGYGGGFQSGGNQGGGYFGGHLGTFNSPDVGQNSNSFKNYKRYNMMNNNTVVSSGYYDTVFDEDIIKIMSILKELGFKTKGMPGNDEGAEEFHLNTKRHDQTHTMTDYDGDRSSSDDVMNDASGINLSRQTVMKHIKAEFGDELPELVKKSDGKIGYDEIMLGLKDTMRNMKYPDKDYAFLKTLKELIKSPSHFSGLEKYDIDESYERNIYGTTFKPNEISNILKEFK